MIACDGLIQLALVLECIAKVAMRLGVIRLDGEGLVIAGDGLTQLPQALERIAKIIMRLGKIRLDGEGLVKA